MNDHRHLQDEVLSAHLDRQLGGAERAGAERHLATCDRCEARLAALGGARDLLALDPGAPLDDVNRRRLVDRAAAGSAGISGARRPAPGTPRRQWWRNPGVLGAAAVAALALGIGVLALGGDDSGDQLAGGISPDVYAGHVGDLDDPHAIRSLLGEVAVAPGQAAGESGEQMLRAPGGGSGSVQGGAPADETDGADSDASRSQADDGDAPAVEAAPTAGLDATRQETGALPPETGLEDAARCLGETSPPEGSELVLAATGRFQDTDAIVLAFRTGDAPRVLALVLARADCTILSAQSIAA